MSRSLISGLLGLLLLPQIGRATDPIYINNGIVTFPPQIDATNFLNNGTFDFSLNPTILPFETSNTQNYTNNGTMYGAVGFQFNNAPSGNGTRKLSANFRNRLTGVITSADSIPGLLLTNGQPVLTALLEPSFLLVSATNVINEGYLTAGGAGILRLVGTNVNLSRSGVQIEPIPALGSINGFLTNWFIPDVAIYDYYWGQSNQTMNSSLIVQAGGAVVVSPPSRVDYDPRAPGIRFPNVTVAVVYPQYEIYTNTMAMTNLTVTNATGSEISTNVPMTNVVQAVFVGLPSGDVAWGARFFPSSDPNSPFNTVSVGIALISTNPVSITPEQTSLYLVDTLASETNRFFYTNFTSATDNLRPQNYLMERLQPFEFAYGFDGNAPFTPDILYKKDFAARTVTNEYAAYSAFVDNIASRPPNTPSGTVTNLPGRVEIVADNLDISRTRFRANGLLNIQAKNVISTSNAVVDCENLSYTLGANNGQLKVQNLAQDFVTRLKGTNYVWSGVWTNTQNMLIENYVPDPDDTNSFIKSDITNVVTYLLYAMIFDASSMVTEVPVVVNSMVTHSTNVVINDSMTVVQSLFIDGQSFTLNGGITLSNTFFINNHGDTVIISLNDWLGTNAPNLRYFTNNGRLKIPSEGHFGDDLPAPYSAFVNHGTIEAYGQTIKSDYCEIGGRNITAAGLLLTARSGKIDGGTLNSGGDVQFFADDLKFNRTTLQTGSRVDLTVTNSLSDAGGGSLNSFSTTDGFRLLRKPPLGDLLGTTINSIAPAFAEVDHVWAGLDRGAIPAGYSNNTALGGLVLTPGANEVSFPPLFFFSGTGSGNALYVDLLDLSHLADYQNELGMNSDLVIYYAAARLSFTPPLTNGVAQQPEEYLDGQFNGHLRWVKDFAGPHSSVDVVINGQTAKVNRALRNSKIIDSDGDGVPNFYDASPFGAGLVVAGAMIQTNPPPTRAFLISWTATSNSVYRVEFATNVVTGNWQLLSRYTNTAPTNRVVTIWDTNVTPGSDRRFYRVGYGP